MALADTLAAADFADLFKVQDWQFVQGFQQQRSATGGGETHYADRAPSLWRAEATTVPMTNAEAEGVMALINSRAGGLKTVLLYNSRLPYPASDPKGEWLASGSNFPVGGTSLVYDFVANDYQIEGRPTLGTSVVSCERSTIGYAETAAGDWGEFAVNEARITDRGLLIEPAATDISLNPVEGASWTLAQVTASDDVGGPYLGIFADPQVVTSTATTLNTRVRSTSGGTPVVASTQYALTFWVKPGSTSIAGFFGTVNAGTSRLTIDLANGYSLVSSTNSRGDMTFVSGRLVGDVHEVKVLWTPSATGGADIGAGPGAGVSGDTLIVVGFRMEAGSIHYSPSGPGAGAPVTRAADAVTLALPAGTHDLTFTFDDDSTQVVSGQFGGYDIPTDLSRRVIKSVSAVKTSVAPSDPAMPKLGTITDRLHVAFTGLPSGYEVPRGTYFCIVFDTSRYYLGQFAEAKTADGSGNIGATEIWPPLPASILGTPDVELLKPPGKFRIVPGSAYPSIVGGLYSEITFSAEQTYSR